MNDDLPLLQVGQDVIDILVESLTNLVEVVPPRFGMRECHDRVRFHDRLQIVPKQVDWRTRKFGLIWSMTMYPRDQRLPICHPECPHTPLNWGWGCRNKEQHCVERGEGRKSVRDQGCVRAYIRRRRSENAR